MSNRIKSLIQAIRNGFARITSRREPIIGDDTLAETVVAPAPYRGPDIGQRIGNGLRRYRWTALGMLIVGGIGYGLYSHPPLRTVEAGETGVRINRMTGDVSEWRDGTVLVLPALHQWRTVQLRDQSYRPASRQGAGDAPFQSVEGLSFGADLVVRYAIDSSQIAALASKLPDNIEGELVEPAVQGVIFKVLARYTVREIFSSKRAEIQQTIEAELKPRLASDGILLRSVQMGKVELPDDYRRGMEKLLAEELESEKMRFTLELKDKRVKETALDAEAQKVRREKAAEAAANEQIIAARAQEEAMKHVLPFKQKQIEQRQLEAEAERLVRIKAAEGSAQARRIEANGEADSRQKLADAEAYRLDRVGKVASEQMAREGALISKHPLLIQKTMADKLSDKISVIIAPPSTNGDFIGASLLGTTRNGKGGNDREEQVSRVANGSDKEGE
ncbi:MAG TPA: SPFH domain-containing protein [Casimicrobium huifangae]|nr:SPFH domain-containing protein [Casimicrobium huifangae]HQA34546.1 SPFH domain-containing protein [Casimicrobium huifangae]HQD66691.1 SPFH domain-containing protein [Casimicrobium huifangae]